MDLAALAISDPSLNRSMNSKLASIFERQLLENELAAELNPQANLNDSMSALDIGSGTPSADEDFEEHTATEQGVFSVVCSVLMALIEFCEQFEDPRYDEMLEKAQDLCDELVSHMEEYDEEDSDDDSDDEELED